jgi:toluene monooxygenase system protein D
MADRPPSAGPILQAGAAGEAVARAIRRLNPGAQVIDRGGYLRVTVPGRCHVTRRAIEDETGGPFSLPGDLEAIMTSFQGWLQIGADEVVWSAAGEPS